VILGREVGVKVIKNRLGSPWTETSVALLSGRGVDNAWSVFENLKRQGIIAVSGSWAAINLDGEVYKFQGWSGLAEKCQEHPDLWPKMVALYER
jgi:hypothetical protein